MAIDNTKPALLFKRGKQASLPTAPNVIDGAFYLTTDSHRLYAGIKAEGAANATLVDLNRYIRTVETVDGATDSLASLTATATAGDFAYVHEGNILAVYKTGSKHDKDGDGWVQINKNTDTKNSAFTVTGSGATDNASLTFTVTSIDGATKDELTVSDTITFIGTKGVDVSVDANGNITVEGCTYTLGGEQNGDNYDISLTPDDDDTGVAASKISLIAGENITLTAKTGGVEISAVDDNTTNATLDVNISGEDITVSVTDTDDHTVTDTQTGALYFTYGKNNTRVSNQGHMDTYSSGEIDAKFRELNGLTYQGTIASEDILLGKTSVKIGDMWMASDDGTIKEANRGKFRDFPANVTAFEKGDLFIAVGEEDANGVIKASTLQWTYVPSGDDTVTDTYYLSEISESINKFRLYNPKTDKDLITHEIKGGATNKISVTSTKNTANDAQDLITTIEHAAVTTAKPTTDSRGGHSVIAISDMVVDSTGHVTSYTTKTTNLATYKLEGATVAESQNIVTVTDTLTDTDEHAHGTSSFAVDASSNDNLKVSASGTSIVMKLEWDTF